jgi:hypothetical protein
VNNKTLFYAAAGIVILLFIPAFRRMIVNPFKNPMLWVVLAVGVLLVYAVSFDTKRFRMNDATKGLMIAAAVGVIIFVMQPGIFSLERQTILSVPEETPRLTSPLTVDYGRQIELTAEGLERLAEAEETLFDEIILMRNERLVTGTLSVDARKAECTSMDEETGECTWEAGTQSVPYEIDLGQAGQDFTATRAETFDITNKVNLWMDYCGVDTCHVPIQIKTTARSFVTISVELEKDTIEYTPAQIIIEREGVPALQVVGTALFLISVMIILVFIMRRFAPKKWAKVSKGLKKIGVR